MFSMAKGTGNSSPSASSGLILDKLIFGVIRIVSYALPDFQSLSLPELAQPPTFFCQFPFYRRTFILSLWNKRRTEASMPRSNVARLFNGNREPGALHLFFCYCHP